MYNDPRLKNEYHVWFGIYDFDCSPDELTSELGIKPTETRIKGEIRLIGKVKHKRINKENAWILKSELPQNTPIEKHIEHLLSKITPHKEKFIKVTNKYYTEFGCAPYYYESNPGIHLDNNLLKEIADLNAKIDIDIYCLSGTVKQLEEQKVINHLIKHLTGVKFISHFDSKDHNEVKVLVNSLKQIEEATYEIHASNMPDLIWNYKPSDEDFEPTFKKIGENLRKIIKYIKQSKFLSSLISDKLENNK